MMRRKIKLKMKQIDQPKVGKTGTALRLDRLAPTTQIHISGCREQTKAIAKKFVSGGKDPDKFIAVVRHFSRKVSHSGVEQLLRRIKFQGKHPAQSGVGVETDREEWEKQTEQMLNSVATIVQQAFQTEYPKKKLEKLAKDKKLKEGVWQMFKQATPQMRHALDVIFTQGKMKGKKNRFEAMLFQEVQGALNEVFDEKKLEEAFEAKNLDEFAQKIGEAVKKDNEGKVQKAVYNIIRSVQKAAEQEKDTDLPNILSFLKEPVPQEAPKKVTEGDKTRLGKQPKPENFPISMFGLVLQGIRKTQQEWEKEKKKGEDEGTTFTIPTPWD